MLANFTSAFNFYGLIDTQDTSVTIVSPVRSQLSYINLGSPSALGTALISSSGGIVMPNSNGGDLVPGDTTQGVVTVSGAATMGGYIQFGLVHGDTVNFYGLTGTDSITFTGTVHGNISPNNVAINFAPGSVNILGFSPTFNPQLVGGSTAATTTFFVATNEVYKPAASPGLTPTANNGSIFDRELQSIFDLWVYRADGIHDRFRHEDRRLYDQQRFSDQFQRFAEQLLSDGEPVLYQHGCTCGRRRP